MDKRSWSSISKTGASNKSSKLDGARPPPGISQVNDAVWLFQNPNGLPKAEIIFFHGLQLSDYKNAFWKTWLARSDENVVWPKDWLGKTFSTARILAISYDSSAGINDGQLDMYQLGENLVSDIIMDSHLNIGQNNCPVILVGHCLGGIMIKQFILSAEAKICQGDIRTSPKVGRFLQNIKGIFYYSTPHGGFNTEFNKANVISSLGSISKFLQLLLTNGSERERINGDFSKVRQNRNMRAFAVMGSLPTNYLGTTVTVVPEEFGRRDIEDYYTLKANHFDICRPENKESGIFGKLRGFIESILDEAKQGFENFQWTPNGVVGLDVIIKKVQDTLLDNSRVGLCEVVGKGKTVGIHGMGGIGKTTLAKVVFNKLNPKFEYSCFVPNVKLIKKKGTLEEEVKKGIHQWGKKVRRQEWSQLSAKRLLLVLDDVDRDWHLETISRIQTNDTAPHIHCIVTCHSELLLIQNDVDCFKIPLLGEEDAKHLFKSYAFSTPGTLPLTGLLEEHMDAIVKKCDGLPLTLEVIGKYLKSVTSKYLKSKKHLEGIWKDTLQALKDADDVALLNEKIWKKLQVSYNGLGEKEQQMFLDAATFFSVHARNEYQSVDPDSSDPKSSDPWTVWDAKAAWSVIYGREQIGWETLVDLSLVYDVKDDEGQIKLHEQLQSMGRRIAMGNDGKKRWWNLNGGFDFLKLNGGPGGQDQYHLTLEEKKLFGSSCNNLVISRVQVFSREGVLKSLSPKRKIFETSFQILACLREKQKTLKQICSLRLSPSPLHPFERRYGIIPRSCVGKLKELEFLDVDTQKLTMEGAEKNEKLPIGNLVLLRCSSLQIFNSVLCPRLAVLKLYVRGTLCLRAMPFSRLHALKILRLAQYSGQTLPDEFGHLGQLERLTFTDCRYLRTLPKTFGLLSRLDYLFFFKCDSLHTLPDSFGDLSRLAHLTFESCDELHIFPESIKHLPALERLEFSWCYGLRTVPEFFGQLSTLEHLSFDGCINLHTLPSPGSFKQLAKLQYFKIDNAPRLQSLPFSCKHRPEALRHLVIAYIGLKTIPDCIKSLPSLEILELDYMVDRLELPQWLGGGFLEVCPKGSERRNFDVHDGKFILTKFPCAI